MSNPPHAQGSEQGIHRAQSLALQGPTLPAGRAAGWARYYDPDALASVERPLFSR